MNYETSTIAADEHLALPGGEVDRRSRRRRLYIALAIGAMLAVGVLWYAMAGSRGEETLPKAAGARSQQIPAISVAVPGRDTVRSIISGTGSLAARREMPIGIVGEGGVVTRVLVEPGTWVRAGQVLATVDRSVQVQTAQSLAAGVEVARADARIAQTELDRALQQATRDAARARVSVAEAQLAEARARNQRLDIRAPEAGLVLARAVEPGQIVQGGNAVLFRIAAGGQLEMLAQLSESDLVRLRPGVPAQVTPVGSSNSFEGQVWQVSPVIDPQTRQGIARIALPYDPALRPGGFASARIMAGASSSPLLPESAVLSDSDGNYVYIVNARDETERRAVTIGEVSDQGVSIASGLDGTERVVLSAGGFLSPGQKVQPRTVSLQR
jgi:HlyD family secretion protein